MGTAMEVRTTPAMGPRTTTATLLTPAGGGRPCRILVGSAPLTTELSPAAIRWRCEEHHSSHSPRIGAVDTLEIAGIIQLAGRDEGSRC